MEQLIKQESQRQIAKQMRQARIRRQIQVRQQAMAWTEVVRKKYDDAKEHEIKNLAEAVTEEAQKAAIENIRHLATLQDLAMAEIGMAHRAAAGHQNVEKLRSLKRLKDEEVAKNRGTAAMMKLAKEKQSTTASSMALLKRKEEVRKLEDKKSKEIISRRPLSITNSTADSRSKPVILGPPEYQPSLAKTLRVAHDATKSPSASSKLTKSGKQLKIHRSKSHERSPHKSQKSKQPSKSASSSLKSSTKVKPTSDSSKSDLKAKKGTPEESYKPQEGVLKRMVRIKVSEPQRSTERLDYARVNFVGEGLNRDNAPTESEAAKPTTTTVRYYDDAIPKGEVKYVAPAGLAVKESSTSPDAWEKGKALSAQLQEEQERKTQLEDTTSQKAAERGRIALKKARLEKQLNQVRTELLEGIDGGFDLGTGSQKAILGLDQDEDHLSDEFSAVETDEEFEFTQILPPQNTLKSFAVTEDQADKHLVLVPITKDDTSLPFDEASSLDSFASYSSPSLHSEKDQLTKEYDLQPLRPASRGAAGQSEDDNQYNLIPLKPKSESPKDNNLSETVSTVEKMAVSLISHAISDATTSASPPAADRNSLDSHSSGGRSSKKNIVVSKSSSGSRTSSGSTVAEINIKTTTSGDTVTVGRKTESLDDLQSRAKDQEKLLRRAHVRDQEKNNSISSPESTIISSSGKHEDEEISVDKSTNGLATNGSSDDTSIRVNIRLQESSDSSTPSRSEQSSISTDYYNPPEGPFTSTPDGKLHQKRRSSRSSHDVIKKQALYHYVGKFLAKKPESIENLPVTSTSSLLIQADSDILSSPSFEAKFSPIDHSQSTSSSSKSSASSTSPASNQLGSSFQAMPLAPVSEEDSDFDSGSTIAETAIKAAIALETFISESSRSRSSNSKSDSRSETRETVSTSESLTHMLGALSTQQGIEKRQLEMRNLEGQSNSQDEASINVSNSLNDSDPHQKSSRRSSRSSSGSFPDASLILRELRSRHKRKSTGSKSSDGSPKSGSGPEKEAERIELLEDITPVKLWETPPKYSVRSETEQLSEVFDRLIDKWANIRIEPPPWYSDLS